MTLLAILAVFVVFVVTGSSASAGKGDRSAPTAPTNLKLISLTETSATLSWNGSSDNSGKFSYKLKISNQSMSYEQIATISQTQTSYTAKYLAPNTPYAFAVYAVDGSGNRSGDSNTIAANTPPDTTPPTTPVLQATAIAPSQVQLTWTKSTDNVTSNCCSYGINVNGTRVTQFINWIPGPSADKMSAVVRHLTPGTNYNFSVSVSDWSAGNNTATSNTVNAATQSSSDGTPPLAPTNLRLVRDDSCGEVWLGWDETTDNADPQDSIEYEIYVNDIVSPLPVGAGINLDFVYANTHGDNIFYIKAVDKSGNSSAPSKAVKLFLWPC
jgi:hypothetical protein